MLRTTLIALTASTALNGAAFAADDEMNIVETAQAAGNFTRLVTALEATGLDETLASEGPFTVFAPTDTAFGLLTTDEYHDLISDIGELRDVLTYHVLPGEVMSSDLSNNMIVETVEGTNATITTGDAVRIENATVEVADIETSNGVIHVIDLVLMPGNETEDS